MKKIFISLLLFLMSGITLAQSNKSLVTPQMARKVAYLVGHNMGMIRGIFQDANKISSIRQTDKIISEIDQHYDCIENFCVSLIDMYGTGDGGYLAFKDCGFTSQEFDIALKIYSNKQKERRKAIEDTKKKAAAEEQIIYDNYIQTGKLDNMSRMKLKYSREKFKANTAALAHYIDTVIGYKGKPIDIEYIISVNDKGQLEKPNNTDKLFEKVELILLSPPKFEFKNLDKTIIMPTKYKFRIVENRRTAFKELPIKIEWDKREKVWYFSDQSDIIDKIGSTDFYAVRNTLLMTINNFFRYLDDKKKKHTISVTAIIDGSIKCYIDDEKLDTHILQNYYAIDILK